MNPILKEFPDRIESERLYIRACQPGDGKAVHEAITYSKEELKKWLPFANQDSTEEETEAGVRKSYAKFIERENFRLHIYRKEDDILVGSTGLHRIDWGLPKFEIGYWVDTRYSKKGYITEAVETLTEFAFDYYEAKRVEIRCDPANENSRRIPEKLGFTLEGVLQNSSMSADGNDIRNTCVFAKVEK
ncbi:N-acetyltransferase [Peribacillus cavernae]|uniref:N-acetyltransferase n=1 Tax=Peribacillus cavernae TaxID=1674310 RepID=A0A3S0UA96_9BACI|nr:GNAT family N-acetyltransferase [Peribacillus cavernae]MDQ0219066.1 RimJ/RimL family protein N-acetyltransferase [Peribacillus cavernae]RUQ26519.1 N-acetyltransferase [Peribacillus cavernae]